MADRTDIESICAENITPRMWHWLECALVFVILDDDKPGMFMTYRNRGHRGACRRPETFFESHHTKRCEGNNKE